MKRDQHVPGDGIGVQDIILLATLAASVFILTGIGASSFGLFIDPIRTELAWTREQASRLPGAFFLFGALASPACGWLIDRFGARIVLPAGIALQMAGLFLASQASAMTALMAGFALAGIGGSASNLCFTYYLTREVHVGVGLSMGIYLFGASGGAAAVPIAVERFVSYWGWRGALEMNVAIVAVVVLPLTFVVARHKSIVVARDSTVEAGKAVRIPLFPFALLALMEVLFMICVMGLYIHFVPIFDGRGFSTSFTVLLLSFGGIVGAIAPIGIGWLSDRMGAGPMLLLAVAVHTAAMFLLTTLNVQSPAVLVWSFALVWGATSGSVSQLAVPILTQIVPKDALGRALGLHAFAVSGAAAIGPVIVGAIADTAGGYDTGLAACAMLSLLSAVPLTALYFGRLRKRKALTIALADIAPVMGA